MNLFFEEFKAFALRGNVIDLAVAVVIGTAFGKIVSSLVDTIIMPTVGILLGGIDFTHWVFTLGGATIAYGKFIQAVVDFLIISLVIFIVVRTISRFKKEDTVSREDTPEQKVSEEVLLLRDIRDSLKNRKF